MYYACRKRNDCDSKDFEMNYNAEVVMGIQIIILWVPLKIKITIKYLKASIKSAIDVGVGEKMWQKLRISIKN